MHQLFVLSLKSSLSSSQPSLWVNDTDQTRRCIATPPRVSPLPDLSLMQSVIVMAWSVQPPVKWLCSCDSLIWLVEEQEYVKCYRDLIENRLCRNVYMHVWMSACWIEGGSDEVNACLKAQEFILQMCKGIDKSLVYSVTDGRFDGMMGQRQQ